MIIVEAAARSEHDLKPLGTGLGKRPSDDKTSPRAGRVLKRVSPETIRQLTPAMIADLEQAIREELAGRAHWLDYRVSASLLGRGFYVTLLAGPEARTRKRLIAEGQWSRLKQLVLYGVLVVMMTVLTVPVVLLVLYAFKSAAGIDLIDGPSPLHPLFDFMQQL